MAVKAKSKVLSIAINNEFIKICELTKNGKSIIVHKTITVPTPERTYSDGMIRDRGTLAKKIKVAIDEHRLTTTSVIFAMASTKIATKEVIIPNVKPNKIADIINMNATDYFPVNIDEYIIQHSVLEHLVDDENKIKVLVMAAPQEMIEAYYDLASSLGLVVAAIDYVGNSTHQALKRQIDSRPSLVIQVENDTTSINIFDNNVLQLQRTIPYGKSILVNSVMEAFGLKYDLALKKLQDEDLLHRSFDGDAVTESMKYLVSNINRVVDYYVTRNSNKPIERAYLIGNATSISGFVQLFERELNLPLEGIEILKDILCDKKTYVNENELSSYITNFGAIMAPVNFIPRHVAEKEIIKDNSNTLKFLIAVSAFGAILLVLFSFVTMKNAQSARDDYQSKVNAIKDIETVVNEYHQAKDMASDVTAYKLMTSSNNDALPAFISSLEEILPVDVSISNMSITNGSVTLSGGASSKNSVAQFIQSLSAVKNVSAVKMGSETESKDSKNVVTVSFTLTCEFSNTVSVSNSAAK